MHGMSKTKHKAVTEALNSWKSAKRYFETVSDPALIEIAIYELEAAQKRYIYLLKTGG